MREKAHEPEQYLNLWQFALSAPSNPFWHRPVREAAVSSRFAKGKYLRPKGLSYSAPV